VATGPVASVERDLTLAHIAAVNALIARHAIAGIELIGFHGHTILHQLRTWQIGDGSLLASSTGIDLGGDFRSADVAAGGEAAAFAPLYRAALASPLDKPLAVLNLGAVGNVIRIGSRAIDIVAFDTGPGNALIDDWALAHTGQGSRSTALAGAGRPDAAHLARSLAHPFFDSLRPNPSSATISRVSCRRGCRRKMAR
jgi:anhydro-N-acetylmuramic acid kinase